jgi:hypothetical protein
MLGAVCILPIFLWQFCGDVIYAYSLRVSSSTSVVIDPVSANAVLYSSDLLVVQ